MKILFLIDTLGLGGAEADLVRLCTWFAPRCEVAVCVFDWRTDVPNFSTLEEHGVRMHVLPTSTNMLLRWYKRASTLRNLRRQFDLCVSFLTGPNALNALTAGEVPAVISIRGSRKFDPILTLKAWILANVIDPISYHRAEAIHSCSEGITWELRHSPKNVRNKIVTIEGTVNADLLLDQAEEATTDFQPSGRPTVVISGRLHPQKGFDRFIDVFSKLKSELREVQLIVIGDGPSRENLLQQCQSLNLVTSWEPQEINVDADVRFIGRKIAPHRYFKHANVFAMPSRYEGLPNMLIEAIAAGVPVICADFPWGARQLLSMGAMSSGFEQPIQDAMILKLGILLPPIDQVPHHGLWLHVLREQLSHSRRVVPRAEADAGIRRFDLEQTGPLWHELFSRIIETKKIGDPRNE